jgi:ATP-dependent exoDNAse (exonuclease V) beta subunit
LIVSKKTSRAKQVLHGQGGPIGRELLSEAQLEVVRNVGTHMLVQAGAGSGKTKLLVAKILAETGSMPEIIDPGVHRLTIEQVGAITFTRKAAGEITERLRKEMLERAKAGTGKEREEWAERAFSLHQGLIGTIDSFAGRIIRDYGPLAGVESGYEVMDEADTSTVHRQVAESELLAGIDRGDPGARLLVQQYGFLNARDALCDVFAKSDRLLDAVERLRGGKLFWTSIGFLPTAADVILRPMADSILLFANAAHDALERRMELDGVLDHTHIVLRAAELARNADVQAAFRSRIKLLLVDEHQDTSLAQATLLMRLAGLGEVGQSRAATDEAGQGADAGPIRLVMVGDPQQAIYGFRNTDITIWNRSRELVEAQGGSCHLLSSNYRSRPTLIRFFDHTLGAIVGRAEADADNRYRVVYQPLTAMRADDRPGTGVEFLISEQAGEAGCAEIVAERIADMLANPADYPVYERGEGGAEVARPVSPRDIAILSRQLRGAAEPYERALRDRGIDVFVLGGRGLYARPEVRDVASMLRAVADPHDPFALAAHLRSPIGGVDDQTLLDLAAVSTGRAGPRGGASLYEALRGAADIITDPDRAARATESAALLAELRQLRERVPHHELIELGLQRSGYYAFLAGAPGAPAGMRNIDKLLRIARRSATEPLFEFVEGLAGRVRRADREDEAPLYTPDDDLVVLSTIHKAKGLEWPYVFVVGMEERLYHQPRPDRPQLSSDLGVALPLQLTVPGQAVPHSAAWNWYMEDEANRNYEEAKRLFYVACTRARDGLFIAGALKKDWAPRTLHNNRLEYRHLDGADSWLRHLHPKLVKKSGDEFEPVIEVQGDAPLSIRVRRGVSQMRDGAAGPPSAQVLRRWNQENPVVHQLAAQLAANGEVGLMADPAVADRQEDLYTRALIKLEFSASELVQFDRCDWKHWFGYVAGISTTTVKVASADRVVNRIAPHERGDILHDYLSVHQDSWTPEERADAMRRVIARRLNLASAAVESNVSEMLVHVEAFVGSDLYARAQAAERAGRPVYREKDFRFEVAPGIIIPGRIDLVFLDEDGWVIVDYKSALFRGIAQHLMPAEVASRAASYRLQASAYSMAVAELMPDHPVARFVFFFTFPGIAEVQEVGHGWPDADRPRIVDIVQKIRTKQYSEERHYAEARCGACEFVRLCRPQGTPAGKLSAGTEDEDRLAALGAEAAD